MKEIVSSYPNKYFTSKHERFKKNIICACKCDCDWILKFSKQKKGDVCELCKEGDHAYPVYRSEIKA